MKQLLMTGAIAFLLGWANEARADVIPGPTLRDNVVNQTNSGLEITALTNSTLQSLVYQNQGGADTIELAAVRGIGIGPVLDSIAVPAGNPTFTASNLDWQLTIGTTYVLVATGNPNNGKYAPYDFAHNPTSDGQISVDTGVFSADLVAIATDPNDWGNFNDITTVSVPEPGGFLLFITAVVSLFGWQLARREKAGETFRYRLI